MFLIFSHEKNTKYFLRYFPIIGLGDVEKTALQEKKNLLHILSGIVFIISYIIYIHKQFVPYLHSLFNTYIYVWNMEPNLSVIIYKNK